LAFYKDFIIIVGQNTKFRRQGRLLWLTGSPDSVEIFPIFSQGFGTFLRKFVAGIPDFAFEGPFDF